MTQSRKKAGRWMRTGQILLAFSVLAIILLQAMGVGLAAGNGSEEIIAHGTGLGGNFDTNLTLLAKGAVKAMHVILIVMTAIAGMMIVFGLEDGKKFLWQVMLGAGLAFIICRRRAVQAEDRRRQRRRQRCGAGRSGHDPRRFR